MKMTEQDNDERICKYCKNYDYLQHIEEGKCKARNNEKTEEDSNCSLFEKRDISTELKDCYYTIVEILKRYCDLEERYYPIVALWIMGTYAHEEFNSYPYLFLNASKGSGKSRLLRLIATLSKNGKGQLTSSLTESVLFKTAKQRVFCIDEFENLEGDYKANLRDLLNSAYKKGGIVERNNYKRTAIEKFDVYTPVAMANISGMESVLGDRCITIILEKSINTKITKLIEIYEKDFSIQKIKILLGDISENLCLLAKDKGFSQNWNDYVWGKQASSDKRMMDFFKKMDETGIEGRNLELLLPLCFIAYLIDEKTLENMLKISQELVKEREEEDYFENKDKIFLRFLGDKIREDLAYCDYVSTSRIANQFREYETEANEWINAKWIGKALKRMKLIKDKKREQQGIKVLINIDKIKM
jgi:hypothetical protein